MSSFPCHPLNKTTAMSAAAYPYCIAAELTGATAVFVSFQRHYAVFTPFKSDDLAAIPLPAAMQFSGNTAICATNAVTTATSVTFGAFDAAKHST